MKIFELLFHRWIIPKLFLTPSQGINCIKLHHYDLLLHLLCFICLITDISTFQNILDFTCYSCGLRSHDFMRCLGPAKEPGLPV